uniref:Uncharacterized protein n=2 Tax=Anguilla anguilla TaxID=7936 RepID=A0A0E9RQH6_ANGAN
MSAYVMFCARLKFAIDRTPSTFLTFERLLFRMDVPVVSQVILSSKRLVTNITGIRPFVCMGSFVDEEVV